MRIDPAFVRTSDRAAAEAAALGRAQTRHLSEAGGLTQFCAQLVTLPPGARTAARTDARTDALTDARIGHGDRDEFLYVLTGTATVIDDASRNDLGPDAAAAWRQGDLAAHQVANLSDAPVTFLIAVSGGPDDDRAVPKDGRRPAAADGPPPRDGDPSPAPGDLAMAPCAPSGSAPSPRILSPNLGTLPDWQQAPADLHPILGPGPGPYAFRLLSDAAGLTRFGAFVEELPPGSASGRRHWHAAEDEMVLVLQGTPTLVEDAETPLPPGHAACWPAGRPVGHRLDNRTPDPVRYLVIGTRSLRDRITYADHDLITETDGPARRYLHKDGTTY